MEFHSRHPNSHGFVGVSCEYRKIDSRCPQPLCTILYYNGTHYNGTLRCIACVGSYAEHCFVQRPVACLAPSHFSKPCWLLWPTVIKFMELVQTMACHLFDASHYLNQCRIISEIKIELRQISSRKVTNYRLIIVGHFVSASMFQWAWNIWFRLSYIAINLSNALGFLSLVQICCSIFSCDQAAIWLVQSVRPSVRPSVCPSVRPSVTPFSPCSHHRIIM